MFALPLAPKAVFDFWLGYALILMVPGPVTALVVTVAAWRGALRGFLVGLATAAGGTALAVAVHAIADIGSDLVAIQGALPVVSAALLVFVAVRIARSGEFQNAPVDAACLRTDGASGFLLALTSPVTAAYFAATFLQGPHAGAADLPWWTIAAIVFGTVVVLRSIEVTVLARPGVSRIVRTHHRIAKWTTVSVLIIFAALALSRGL